MRRWVLAAVLLVGCGDGESRPAAPSAPVAAPATPPSVADTPTPAPARRVRARREVLATVGRNRIVKVSPRTLRERSPRVRLKSWSEVHAISPDGAAAAFAMPHGGVELVDLRHMRSLGRHLRRHRLTFYGGISWPRPSRIVVANGTSTPGIRVTVIDARGRIVARRDLELELVAAAATPDGLAIVGSPPRQMGRAQLTVVDHRGATRSFAIEVQAGFDLGDGTTQAPTSRSVRPGLAVDTRGRFAYVVDALEDRVVRVDLVSGAVSEHPLGLTARLSKQGESWDRRAAWLGAGRLVVGGNRMRSGGREAGSVLLVDTRSWQAVRLPTRSGEFAVAGDRVVARDRSGATWAIFDRHGARVSRVRAGRHVYAVRGSGPYIYGLAFDADGRTRRMLVIDARTGRTVERLGGRGLPVPLER